MPTVISVEHVSKQYRLGQVGTGTLSHDINRWWHKVRGKEDPYLMIGETNDRSTKGDSEYSWALRDISFKVNQGEVLGIIGRNGAGKSTLLKILSRVTMPTSGDIKIKGRIASLLEVGTGFHPELTGRENIFLNGAILGMRKAEIAAKFDEIVDFSGCARYIDTPVKRYSSGMYVRLAFAVAAHLEPEILIIDEVLAVGDAEFQKKCLGKMKDVAGQGRTVLFVSHNMAAVKSLCDNCVFLNNGEIHSTGPTKDLLKEYLSESSTFDGLWTRHEPVPESEGIYFLGVKIENPDGTPQGIVDSSEDFIINIDTIATRDFIDAQIAIRVTNHEGVAVFSTCNTDATYSYVAIPKGRVRYKVKIPGEFLAPGNYSMTIVSHIPRVKAYDRIDENLGFRIEDTGTLASLCKDDRLGVVTPRLNWDQTIR